MIRPEHWFGGFWRELENVIARKRYAFNGVAAPPTAPSSIVPRHQSTHQRGGHKGRMQRRGFK